MHRGLYETVLEKSPSSHETILEKPPPDHFILHVGTNDLSSEKSSMKIAESTINLACRLKNEIYDVSVSTIILRTDDKKLDEEGMEVNLRGRIFS